jgi:tetratricopeptide (TPR) repeat protein
VNGIDFHYVINNLGREKADILYSMGVYLIKKRDYSQALEKLLQAKQLFESDVASSNRSIQTFSRLFNSIALVYLHLKDNFNALTMLKRVIDIRTTFLL